MDFVIGFCIAIVIALSGVGAGVITAPLLILFLHVPVDIAVSTALAYSAIVKLMPQVAGGVKDQIQRNFAHYSRLLPAIRSQMIENPKSIYGRVYVDPGYPQVVAWTLESGSRPHEIVARNATALYFFWKRLGINVAFKRVHHPGFEGKSYMQATLSNMREQIESEITDAVRAGARQA